MVVAPYLLCQGMSSYQTIMSWHAAALDLLELHQSDGRLDHRAHGSFDRRRLDLDFKLPEPSNM